MKKHLAIICLASFTICMILQAKAQDMKSPDAFSGNSFMIGITGGYTSLSGDLAKTDYDAPTPNGNGQRYYPASGFAGPGYNLGITGTWFLNKNFGISAMVSYVNYSIKGIQNVAQGFQVDFFVDSSTGFNEGHASAVNFLVGPYYTLPLSDKLSLDTRWLVGLVDATLGGWKVILTDGGITHADTPPTQNAAHATALGFQAGLGLRYKINDKWGVMMGADYYFNQPKFTITNDHRNTSIGREITSFDEAITGVNANITLCYMLKRR